MKPWYRRNGESPEDYARFLAFRDQAHPRSLTRVVVAGYVVRSALCSELARQWDWHSRAASYDDEMRDLRDNEMQSVARLSARDRQLTQERIMGATVAVVERELGKLLAACEMSEAPGLVKAEVLLSKIPDVIKALRLLGGESTENVAGGGADASHENCIDMTVCDAIAIEEICAALDRAKERKNADLPHPGSRH